MSAESGNQAHDKDGGAQMFGDTVWARPTPTRPFRTCSYCGSMHPLELLGLLKGAETGLQLADMKYGYPHKFYTDEYFKFYTLHLIDVNDSDFIELTDQIAAFGGVHFIKDDKGISWKKV